MHTEYDMLVVLQCRRWSNEHSFTCRPGSGWPFGIEAHENCCIIRASSVTQIRTNMGPGVSIWTAENCLLIAGLWTCMPLARLPCMPQYHSLYMFPLLLQEDHLENGMEFYSFQ